MFGTIENQNIQLFFKLLNLHAQSGLRYEASLSGFGKMAMVVYGDDVFKLSYSHLLSVIAYR